MAKLRVMESTLRGRSRRYSLFLATILLVETFDITTSALPPKIYKEAVFASNLTKDAAVYASGLYCRGANFSQTDCQVVELKLDIIRPAFNASTNVSLPNAYMPVIVGIHGGSYSHGSSSEQVY